MNQKLHDLLDPRGFQNREVIQLAPRVTVEDLRNGKIAFYNNTKLDFCNYIAVFDRIKERFAQLGVTNFVDFYETAGARTRKSCTNMLQRSPRKSRRPRLSPSGTWAPLPPRRS